MSTRTALVVRVLLAAVAVLGAVAASPVASGEPTGRAGPCGADEPDSVTIVLQYGDLGRETEVHCATGVTDETTGYEALVAVGVAITGTNQAGVEFICRLNGLPAADQPIGLTTDPGYTETCVKNPPQQAYWTYWWAAPGGEWTYATRGYLRNKVHVGGFEAYSFSHLATTTDAIKPTIPPVRATAPTTAPPESAASPPTEPVASGPPLGALIGVGAVVLLAGAAVVLRNRRAPRFAPTSTPAAAPGTTPTPTPTTAPETTPTATPESDPTSAPESDPASGSDPPHAPRA